MAVAEAGAGALGISRISWMSTEGMAVPVGSVEEAALAGDKPAAQAIEEGACALGAGVANIINIFNPDRVVLSGGVSVLGQDFLDRVTAEAGKRAFSESAAHARIATSVVGPEVGAMGAAGLIRDHLREN